MSESDNDTTGRSLLFLGIDWSLANVSILRLGSLIGMYDCRLGFKDPNEVADFESFGRLSTFSCTWTSSFVAGRSKDICGVLGLVVL